jgi:SAM-dependent methyltransferase
MGLYSECVLPALLDWTLDDAFTREQRSLTLAGLHGTVLEVGLGTALNLPHYPPQVTRLIAVEPSAGMQRRARGRIAAAPFPVEVIGFDGEGRYPLPDASVDAVVTTLTLCTIPDPGRALAEIRRVLKPGGPYRFYEHGAAQSPAVQRWQNRLNPIQNVIGGGCNLNRPIDRLVNAAGFADVRLERFDMPGVPRIVGSAYRGVGVK